MSYQDLVSKLISEYCDFNYNTDKLKTLQQLGFESIDQLEFLYQITDKLDLRERVPYDMNVEQIVNYLESKSSGASTQTN